MTEVQQRAGGQQAAGVGERVCTYLSSSADVNIIPAMDRTTEEHESAIIRYCTARQRMLHCWSRVVVHTAPRKSSLGREERARASMHLLQHEES